MARRGGQNEPQNYYDWLRQYRESNYITLPNGQRLYGLDAENWLKSQDSNRSDATKQSDFSRDVMEQIRREGVQKDMLERQNTNEYMKDLRDFDQKKSLMQQQIDAQNNTPENQMAAETWRRQQLRDAGFPVGAAWEDRLKQMRQAEMMQASQSKNGDKIKLTDIYRSLASDPNNEGKSTLELAKQAQDIQSQLSPQIQPQYVGESDDGFGGKGRPIPIYGDSKEGGSVPGGMGGGYLKIKGQPLQVFDPVNKNFKEVNNQFNPMMADRGGVYRSSDVNRYLDSTLDRSKGAFDFERSKRPSMNQWIQQNPEKDMRQEAAFSARQNLQSQPMVSNPQPTVSQPTNKPSFFERMGNAGLSRMSRNTGIPIDQIGKQPAQTQSVDQYQQAPIRDFSRREIMNEPSKPFLQMNMKDTYDVLKQNFIDNQKLLDEQKKKDAEYGGMY